MTGTYDYGLVALSVLIAVLASYTALDLAARVTAARGHVRFAWLLGGATGMGLGIWSMHYIGMLAFSLPISVLYDWPMVLLSLLAAVATSAIALFVVSREDMRLRSAVIGSIIMGVGIATMHYTGMAAMRLPAMCHYSSPLVALSVVLAIIISFVALWLTFHFRNDEKERWKLKIASAVLMGAAIPVMHYTGMAAAGFTLTGIEPDLSHAVSVSGLGVTGITVVTFMVLGLTLLTSMVDRRFSALESSEERLRLIINTALDSVVTMDAAGSITNWNSEAEKTFGWSAQEAIGKTLPEMILPERLRSEKGLLNFLGSGQGMMVRQRTEIEALHREGHEFPVEVAISSAKLDDNWIYSTFIRDITQHKRSQQELLNAKQAAEEANHAKSVFLANMSHELRTPLNAIIGYSEMLEEETQELGKAAITEDLQRIQTSGKHLLALINDILDLSKIEAGKMGLSHDCFSVAAVIEEICNQVKPTVAKNNNALQVSVANNVGEMRGDLTKVRQILLNLLSNACKFTDHGSISIHVSRYERQANAWIEFKIGDTGIGISLDQQANLFKEFAQADASISRRYGGTGLGLAISDRFVQMMQGQISVESEPGRGSIFTVQLPANPLSETLQVKALEKTTEAIQAQSVRRDRDTILVIDDDPSVVDLMSRHLNKLGLDVVIGKDGKDGLRLAQEVKPFMITLDLMMPTMDGWAVLQQLKANRELAHIPVIVVSVVDNQQRGMELGAAGYLVKPIDREKLGEIIKQYRIASASKELRA
ncbi:MAG TPA: MHYT domain-containing protein [Pyrinomonadaceae bacterium]|nr:MHYT domain-containing protein [Pyrinomonadaceae bacterium]